MNLRPLLQIQWPAPPPPRAGRTARRFGAPLTPRLARRPLCGGRRSAVGGRRSAAGGRPVRRGALRLDEIQFQPIFSFKLKTLPNLAPPGEIRGYKLKGILKYISQNKVDASRRAEKRRSLRVQVEVRVSGKSDSRNHQAIVQPRLYDSLMVTRITLPRHTNLHLHPQATTFLSPPGGIYLILRNVL